MMVRRISPYKVTDHLLSPTKKTFYECRVLFLPYYELFGGDKSDGFSKPCLVNKFKARKLKLKKKESAEFVAMCEDIRQILLEQKTARHQKLQLLENILARLKFMSLKYHIK